MVRPRLGALLAHFPAGGERLQLAARAGAIRIDAAACTGNIALQLGTMGGFLAGSRHIAQMRGELPGQPGRHPTARRIVGLGPVKRNTEKRAASATVKAR